jgi:hypothetical protein
MDIDKYSRLLHAVYVARQYYVMAGAMNVYGKTELERKQGRHEFERLRNDYINAAESLRKYENGS